MTTKDALAELAFFQLECMIVATMLRRREFLLVAAAGVAAAMFGCRTSEAVLKIPENADECFDLFRFFTDSAFGFEQARAGLSLTGEPRVLQASPTWRRHTFEDQKGLAERLTLDTSSKDDGTDEYLSAIYINYRHPIGVSLSTMTANLGFPRTHSEKVPVPVDRSPAAFTNLMPGQKEKEVTSYGFHPEEPIAPGFLKGDVLFTCDATYWDTKPVKFLRFQRSFK